MEFWLEFLASREFVARGFGGVAGILSGHPLDTLRIHLQQPMNSIRPSSLRLVQNIVSKEGPSALYSSGKSRIQWNLRSPRESLRTSDKPHSEDAFKSLASFA